MIATQQDINHVPTIWPKKHDLLGLYISEVEYDEAVACIIDAAEKRHRAVVSCHAVHAVITISKDPELKKAANRFEMITADGQPVRWALNALHRTGLKERVYGPELMWRVLCEAAIRHIPIYLYGGSPDGLRLLIDRLQEKLPSLTIVGSESPPYRPLTSNEALQIAHNINETGAAIVLIGLGCPKQDRFAAMQSDTINAVQMCVGAAFDFHAGSKPSAPAWMQAIGTEWVFRLMCEPRRLWRRYLLTNTQFACAMMKAYCFPVRNDKTV